MTMLFMLEANSKNLRSQRKEGKVTANHAIVAMLNVTIAIRKGMSRRIDNHRRVIRIKIRS